MSISTYISPTFNTTNQYVKFRVVIDLINQDDIVGRRSYIRRRLQAWRTNTGYETFGSGNAQVNTDGLVLQQAVGSTQKLTYNSYTTLFDDYQYVQHGLDGKKENMSFGGYFILNSVVTGAWSYSILTLPAIPVGSTILASNGLIEGSTNIEINRASSNFLHTLEYSFGDTSPVTGAIATLTNLVTVPFNIPSSFYAKIPNAKSGVCTLTCKTYDNGVLIGTKQTTFVASVNEITNAPDIVVNTLVDTDSTMVTLTNDNNKLVAGFSNLGYNLTMTAKNGASIVFRKITCGLISNEISGVSNPWAGTLNDIASGTIVITTTDSRGIVKTTTINKTLVPYIVLTNTPIFKRLSPTSGTVQLTFTGNYFNSTFGTGGVANTLTKSWRYRELNGTWLNGAVAITDVKSGNTYSNGASAIALGTNFLYNKNYEFEMTVVDKITNLTIKEIFVLKGTPPLAVKTDRIECDVDLYLKNNSGVLTKIVDLFYPIGKIEITENNVNPSTRLGGTWIAYGTGRMLVGVDTTQTEFNTPAKTGGSKWLQSHRHTIGHTNFSFCGYGTNGPPEWGAILANSNWGGNTPEYSPSTTYPSSGLAGGGNSENLPPYIAVYIWKRTA